MEEESEEPTANPWAHYEGVVTEEQCPNHPGEEVFCRGYCHDCDWALQVIETEATAILGDQPTEASRRRYFFLCPEEHGFTSRQSGADAICRRCRDMDVKHSVPSCGYEEPWPTLTEVGPELQFEFQPLEHGRALMVRVDPNALDLRRTDSALKDSFKQNSIQALIQVGQDMINDMAGERPTKSEAVNQLVSKSGHTAVLAELRRISAACQLLEQLASGRDVEVFGKTREGSFSDAPNECSRGSFLSNIAERHRGLRAISIAVEVKGERYLRGEEQKGPYRGLKVNKENHMVLILTSVAARQQMDCLKHLPFHGIVELLKSASRSHHDQNHCRGCDFLGRLCGASKVKTIVRTKVCGHQRSRFILKGLPNNQDQLNAQRTQRLMEEIEREMRRQDATVALEWSSIEIRQARHTYQSEAVVYFFQGELPYQICEQVAQRVMQQHLQDAERSFRAEFEGQAPGILYVADCYEDHPYTADKIKREVSQDGSECMGWFSQHQRSDLPRIRLISAPHWLARAVESLPEISWRFYRLTLPWEVLSYFDRCFYPDLSENWAEHLRQTMRLSEPLENLGQPARVFRDYAAGLEKLGRFPTGAPYQNRRFYDELETQWCTLLRHVYLFGKPTSAKREPMANSGDPEVEEASEPSDSEEETRAPSPDQHQQDVPPPTPEASTPPSPAPVVSTPSQPDSMRTASTDPSNRIRCGRPRQIFRANDGETVAEDPLEGQYIDLEIGDWVIWKPESDLGNDASACWSYATVRSHAGDHVRQGYVPNSHLQSVVDYEGMPLCFEVEMISDGFNVDPIARGGTCDVYKIDLDSGSVAAKLLRRQESQALVCAMHDAAHLFQTEVETMKRLQHDNIAIILDSGVTTEGRFLIVEEFVSSVTLADSLDSIDFKERLRVALALADALTYVHQMGIIHRDVKSANVLVDVDAAGSFSAVKLSDFGLAKGVQERAVGGYMDPECMRGEGRSTMKSDVYSFGIVLLDLITGKECGPENDHYKAAKRNTVSFHSAWPEVLRQHVVELAKSCVYEFGEDRPSMADVKSQLQQLNGHFSNP